MKKLLNLLLITQLGILPPTVMLEKINNNVKYNIYYNKSWNEIPFLHYQKMEEIMNNNEDNIENIFKVFEETYKMIYLIVEKENLELYMQRVHEYRNYIQTFELNNWYTNEFNRIRLKIDSTYANWIEEEDFDSLTEQFINLVEDEIYLSSKTYYAYNQTSAHFISEDIEYYQNIRIKNIEASARMNSIVNQIESSKLLISEAERQQGLIDGLSAIYDNWIENVKILEDRINEYSEPFNDFQAYEKSLQERKKLVIDETVKIFVEPEQVDEVIKYLEYELENREIDFDKEIDSWIYDGLDHEGIITNISNEDLANNVQKEVKKRIDNLHETDDIPLKDIKVILFTVIKDAFQIDTALIKGLQDAMNEYYQFVNVQLPKVSDEINSIFKANNLHVSSELYESFMTFNRIVMDLADEIMFIFLPNKVYKVITQTSLGRINEIETWWKNQLVTEQIGKVIPLLEQAKEETIRIPEDVEVNMDEEQEKIKKLEKEFELNFEVFEATSEELKNSKYEVYEGNLNEWNEFMLNYFDYLEINESKSMIIEPDKYFNKLYIDYELLSVQRFFVYNKMARTASRKELKVLKNFKEDNDILTEIFSFVYQHKEDFK